MEECVVDKRQVINRFVIYGIGILILAFGITLNTKTGLGVSTLVSVAYTIAGAWNLNFALMSFVLFCCFAGIEILLKYIFLPDQRKGLWFDLLQIPFSLAFSLLMNLYVKILPQAERMGTRILLLVVAIICTGVGAAMIVNMHLLPNPADGLAQTIGMVTKRGMGLGKNILDCSCVAISVIIGLVARGQLIGIGVGTIIAMIAVGRVIAVFNHACKAKMCEWTGLAM